MLRARSLAVMLSLSAGVCMLVPTETQAAEGSSWSTPSGGWRDESLDHFLAEWAGASNLELVALGPVT